MKRDTNRIIRTAIGQSAEYCAGAGLTSGDCYVTAPTISIGIAPSSCPAPVDTSNRDSNRCHAFLLEHCLVFNRRQVADRRVTALRVVEAFDVTEDAYTAFAGSWLSQASTSR